MNDTVNYDGTIVKFDKLGGGILDRCIRNGYPIDAVRYLPLWRYLIKPNDICYDIGAYIGTHSIAFSLCGGQVHAFEASPNNFDRCKTHCEPFNVKTHKAALFDKEKEDLTRFGDCNWDDCGNIPVSESNPEQQIKYVILEKFCEENSIPWPNFIKMDIEGMESIVLNTFHLEKVLKNRPIMYIEKHPGNCVKYEDFPSKVNFPSSVSVEDGGFDFNRIRDEWGYVITRIENNQLVELDKNLDLNPLDREIICFSK
jgi:FkbM family methyltransferase